MSGVVCAVRGGPDSRPTINRSIILAKETDLPLYFLYVVNLDFLSRTISSRVHAISHDMKQMGEFILLAAQASAAENGIEAEGLVRHGNVADEIVKLCDELDADYAVLGEPGSTEETNSFAMQQFQVLVERIEATGTKVVLTQGKQA